LIEEHMMLKESAQGWFNDNASIPEFREMRAARTIFSSDIWNSMAAMGWCGLVIPEKFGGSDFGFTGAGIIASETGKHLTISPFISTAITAAAAIGQWGSETQCSELLPRIAEGEIKLAFAIDESGKHSPANIDCTAQRDGDQFVLNGKKVFVAGGTAAEKLIVSVRSDESTEQGEGVSLFIIDASVAGVCVEPLTMLDSRDAAHIELKNVKVDDSCVLGELEKGEDILGCILAIERVMLAAEMIGCAQQSFDLSIDYLKVRKQFGKTIGSYQALQHRAAELYIELTMASSLISSALQALDVGAEDSYMRCSAAKAKANRVALKVANESIQIHGGIGMTDEYDVGLYLKRIRVAQEQYGDYGFLADDIALQRGF